MFICVHVWLLMTSFHMSRWRHVLVLYTACVAVSGTGEIWAMPFEPSCGNRKNKERSEVEE